MPARGILSAVNRQYDDVFVRYPKEQCIGKTREHSTPGFSTDSRKRERPFNDARDSRVDLRAKLFTEGGAPPFVPPSDGQDLSLGFRPKNNGGGHPRFNSVRRTSDQGTAESGSARCAAHRRSSWAACSSVRTSSASRSESERLSQSAIASSARSPAGSLRSCESVVDSMASIFSCDWSCRKAIDRSKTEIWPRSDQGLSFRFG